MLANVIKLFFVINLLLSSSVQATTLQTWRLTAIALDSNLVSTPAFLATGSIFNVDYVIDVDAAYDGFIYNSAIREITFNGETSITGGYILAFTGLQALNVSINPRVNDSINFSSFNYFSSNLQPSIALILNDIHQNLNNTQFRFDFAGGNSIFATPISFNQSVSIVPLPASGLLMLSGLSSLVLLRKRKIS